MTTEAETGDPYEPGNAQGHQTWKRPRKTLPWNLQTEHGLSNTSIPDFWPPELCEMKILLF